MYKGIVMEIHDNKCTVLHEGVFVHIKKRGHMTVGMKVLFTQEDIMKQKKTVYTYWKQAAAVAMIFMMAVFGWSYYNSNWSPYSAVTLDINPSVELILNQKDQVIDVIALNEDANILITANIDGMNLDEALNYILDKASKAGYLQNDKATAVVIATVPLKKASEKKQGDLVDKIEDIIDKNDQILDDVVAIVEASEAELEEALKSKIPLGVVVFKDQLDTQDVDNVSDLIDSQDKLAQIDQLKGVKVKVKQNQDGTYDVKLKKDIEEDILDYLSELENIDGDQALTDFINQAKDAIEKGQDLDLIEDLAEEYLDIYKQDDDSQEDRVELKKIIGKLRPYQKEEEVAKFIDEALSLLEETGNLEAYLDLGEDLLDTYRGDDEEDQAEDLEELIEMLDALSQIEGDADLDSFLSQAYESLEGEDYDLKALKDQAKDFWMTYKKDLDDDDDDEDQAEDLEELIEMLDALSQIEGDADLDNFLSQAYEALAGENYDLKALKDQAKDFWMTYKKDLDDDDDDEDQAEDLEELIEMLDALSQIEEDADLDSFLSQAYEALEGEDYDLKALKDQAKDFWMTYKKDLDDDDKDQAEDLEELIDMLDALSQIEGNTDLDNFLSQTYEALAGENYDLKALKDQAKDFWMIYKKDLDDDDDEDQAEDLDELIEMLDVLSQIEGNTDLDNFLSQAYEALEGEDYDLKALKDQAKDFWMIYKKDLDDDNDEDQAEDLDELIEMLDVLSQIEGDTDLDNFLSQAYESLAGDDYDLKALKDQAKDFWMIYKKDLEEDEDKSDYDQEDEAELVALLEALELLDGGQDLTEFIALAYDAIDNKDGDLDDWIESAEDYLEAYEEDEESDTDSDDDDSDDEEADDEDSDDEDDEDGEDEDSDDEE